MLLSSENVRCDVIFKDGDDLRQDQVVLQMINFMDEVKSIHFLYGFLFSQFKILRRENFDLKLTPYKVLATSSRSGKGYFFEKFNFFNTQSF